MNADTFRNAILLLNCITADEFDMEIRMSFHWTDPGANALWDAYQKDPVKFYIHASDAHRAALWAIIEKRLTIGESND